MSNSEYSRLSLLAVISAIAGILATGGMIAAEFAILALPGIVTGVAALVAIRKYELSGRSLAITGIGLSVAFALLTPILHISRFRSESLPGYERIDFASVSQPKNQRLDRLVGRKVCFKGYVLYSGKTTELTTFMLSPDGNRRETDTAVLVQLPSDETWDWQPGAVAVSGTLIRNPKSKGDPKTWKFVLKVTSIRISKTPFDLAPLASGPC